MVVCESVDWSFAAQALWNLAAGMVRRSKTLPGNVHKHEARGKILDALRSDPGKNLQALCDDLHLTRGTASYHLYVLERAGAIGSVTTPHTTHFFPSEAGSEERAGLAVLRRERALEVVQQVIDRPGIVQRELLAQIGMSRKVFRDYKRDLLREGLIQEERRDRHCHYAPTSKLVRLLGVLEHDGAEPAEPGRPPTGPSP
jgi:predicted transcriptional regulator